MAAVHIRWSRGRGRVGRGIRTRGIRRKSTDLTSGKHGLLMNITRCLKRRHNWNNVLMIFGKANRR